MKHLFCLAFFTISSYLLGYKSVLSQTSSPDKKNAVVEKTIILNTDSIFQVIDGFGVNVNPDQWRDGNLKKAIDLLVDDLGCSAIRLDCFGNGLWLDPAKMNANGKWPDEYLKEVYTSKPFTDAWQTFRYFNSKGVNTFMNVSGIVPDVWIKKGTKELENYEAYAEMQATMVDWARNKEKLDFDFFAPFNETNFVGSVEGPGIFPQNKSQAFKAIIKKFNEHKLDNLKYIVFCDGNIVPELVKYFLADKELVSKTFAISGHTYGHSEERDDEFNRRSDIGKTIDSIKNSAYKNSRFWLTEYGDLDQTGEIEWEFAWRCQRRLLKGLNDGVNLAQQWDAWDNLHKHDKVWAKYGVIKTDTTNWSYTPKHRYYAAKHIYKYVRPGWKRIEIKIPDDKSDPGYVYQEYTSHLKNIKLMAFVSPDGKDFTVTGMNLIESDVTLTIQLPTILAAVKKSINNYRTTRHENFVLAENIKIVGNELKLSLKEKSIFSITTLK